MPPEQPGSTPRANKWIFLPGSWRGWIQLIALIAAVYFAAHWFMNYLDERRREGGLIIVESPEVYSRERLVNDRFTQTAWLEQELKNSWAVNFPNQSVENIKSLMMLNASITAGVSRNETAPNGGEAAEFPPKTAPEAPQEGGKKENTARLTPTDEFRDKLAYREEIRKQIMETMLDDRHDIKGNTLYRLNFDTTIFPSEDTQQWAVIEATLSRSRSCDEPGVTGELCINMEDLRDQWIVQTETILNNALDSLHKLFVKGQIAPSELANISRFSYKYTQREPGNIGGPSGYKSMDLVQLIAGLNRIQSVICQPASKETPNDIRCARKAYTEIFDIAHLNGNREAMEARLQHARFTLHKQILLSARRGASKLVPERLESTDSSPEDTASLPSAELEVMKKDFYPYVMWLSHLSRAAAYYESLYAEQNDHIQKTNIVNRGKGKEDVDPTCRLLHRNESICIPPEGPDYFAKWHREIEESQLVELYKLYFSSDDPFLVEVQAPIGYRLMRLQQELESAGKWEDTLIKQVMSNYLVDKYGGEISQARSHDDTVQHCQHQIQLSRPVLANSRILACFAELEVKDCEIQLCRIAVDRPFEREKALNITDKSSENLADKALDRRMQGWFSELLEKDLSAYSYAITPRESSQRHSIADENSRQTQLFATLFGAMSGGGSKMDINTALEAVEKNWTRLEQIKRQPVVLSFGRGTHFASVPERRPANRKPSTEIAAESEGDTPKSDFGWLVGPKYRNHSTSDKPLAFVQTPSQQSLSAVVSIPSWWSSIQVNLTTCWLHRSRLLELTEDKEPDRFCNDHSAHRAPAQQFSVRLPSTIDELPRKFGYSIERVPRLDSSESPLQQSEFFVGQENASILIRGKELWRSTVVMLGNQKASRIEVLPDMDGIIATFDLIRAPSTRVKRDKDSGDCVVEVGLSVWTSEGSTDPMPIKIFDNENLKSLVNKDYKYMRHYPSGFGPCYPPGPLHDPNVPPGISPAGQGPGQPPTNPPAPQPAAADA